ncbi:MAG: molybdopterin-dependent oxidoreductase [Chloroflexi bacterium]|nr:molybdopterin-dependent oxidoreductase [Chloroflexota bacterium]
MHGKANAFIIHQTDPFNGGPDPRVLAREAITPADLFYVRGHAPVPQIPPEDCTVVVDGLVSHPLTLRLSDLQRGFPVKTSEVTLQCAGNRRTELHNVKPMQPNALLWMTEAISNATWTGVSLSDILMRVGVQDEASHVAFLGADRGASPNGDGFGGSIPLSKAQGKDVLLAWAMNGEPLQPIHGGPLRVVVPGYYAARSVKWLNRITVQDGPSDNHFQSHDYKVFPPDVTEDNVEWEAGEMLGEQRTHAALLSPVDGDAVDVGKVTLEGYAMAGGDSMINGVEISLDGGESWRAADLTTEPRQWIWTLWRAEVELPAGEHTIIVRANDNAGSTQPPAVEDLWNFRGYQNFAWHRVAISAS